EEVRSKIVSHRSIKPAPLSELRCADADSAAITQFVDLVEQIDDIETDLKASGDIRNFQISLKRDINGSIIRHTFGVGEAATKSTAVEPIAGEFPILPGVSGPNRGGPALVVIQEDPMFVDECVFGRIEKKLRRTPVNTA